MIHLNPLGYVGPGPGLTMVWSFIALLGTIALALLSLLLWPIRMAIRWIRGEQAPPTEAGTADVTAPAVDASAVEVTKDETPTPPK